MQTLIGVFGLRKVYRNQVENVTNQDYQYWRENANFGYFGGGYGNGPPASHSYNSRFDFSTDVVTELTRLTATTAQAVAISSKKYGYVIGGRSAVSPSPDSITNVQRLDFVTEALSNPGKNLSISVRGATAIQSTNYGEYGYFAGGVYPSLTFNCYIARFDFSSESISQYLGSSMTTGRFRGVGVNSYNSGYSYIGGGGSPQVRSSIERFDFSTNVSTLIPATLTTSVVDFTGTHSMSYGYFAGGYNGPAVAHYSNIGRIDFSTESVADVAFFPGTQARQSAVTSNTIGYFAAGAGGTLQSAASIWKLNYATETLSENPNAFNNASRWDAAGYQASK